MFPSSANGVVSRMPSPVGGDPLDYKAADSLMAKDQHGNVNELEQEAVPLILLLDYYLYKGEYVTRICHSDCMRQTQYTLIFTKLVYRDLIKGQLKLCRGVFFNSTGPSQLIVLSDKLPVHPPKYFLSFLLGEPILFSLL